MLKKLALAAAAVALGAVAAHAATAVGTFTVQATIAPVCTVDTSTANVDFLTIGGTASQIVPAASTPIIVNCSSGTGYTITMASAHAGGSTGFQMINGAKSMAYELFPNSYGNPQWDATVGGTYSGAGSGGNQTINLYARIPAQPAPGGVWTTGAYTDTVTMTLTY